MSKNLVVVLKHMCIKCLTGARFRLTVSYFKIWFLIDVIYGRGFTSVKRPWFKPELGPFSVEFASMGFLQALWLLPSRIVQDRRQEIVNPYPPPGVQRITKMQPTRFHSLKAELLSIFCWLLFNLKKLDVTSKHQTVSRLSKLHEASLSVVLITDWKHREPEAISWCHAPMQVWMTGCSLTWEVWVQSRTPAGCGPHDGF